MTDDDVPDDACIDADGEEWPEHDYRSYGSECRRCGAEAPR